jgi:chromosome segregation ATPase
LELEADLAVAQKEIDALHVELSLMSGLRFEDDLLLWEYENVLDRIFTESGSMETERLWVCSDPACSHHAQRLRERVSKDAADACMHDREMRLHGYFMQMVRPLEALRVKKDAQIESLRLRLKRLECATFQTADGVTGVNDAVVKSLVEKEKLEEECRRVRVELDALRAAKTTMQAEIAGLQTDLEDARLTIEDSAYRMGLCRAELHRLKQAETDMEKLWEKIKLFKEGKDGAEFERRAQVLLRLEEEIERAQGRLRDANMQEADDEDYDDGEEVRLGSF